MFDSEKVVVSVVNPLLLVLEDAWHVSVCACVHAESYQTLRPRTIASQAPRPTGILQAKVLQWIAVPFSRGTS